MYIYVIYVYICYIYTYIVHLIQNNCSKILTLQAELRYQ